MKKAIKKILYKLFSKEYKDIYKEIENYKYISFDIFDTLIKRNVEKPTDIFELIPKRYNKELKNFKEKRINAEHIARKQSKFEDVTLEEIYDCLEYPKKEKKELINIEIELEKEYCTTNKEMLELYNYLIEKNKKIYLTSDMYLSKETIKDILKSNGYSNYKKIYLSSDKRFSKKSGNLFKSLLKEEKISNKQLIHIGDNFIGDYLSPKKLNIKAILIKTKVENTLFESKNNKTLEYNILSSFINNNIDYKADEYFKFGYEVLGPILYSFTSWLHERIKEDKIDKIYFLARDAKIIMEIYKEQFKKELPIFYIKASRKSVTLANLNNLIDFNDMYNRVKSLLIKVATVGDLIKVLGLGTIECPYKDKIVLSLKENEKEEIFNVLQSSLEEISFDQHNYLKRYLEQNDFFGNIAIVDIGWYGTIQYYFRKYVQNNDTNLFGYYYGVYYSKTFEEYENLNRKGFLIDGKNDYEYQIITLFGIGIFEAMFLSTDSSTIGYKEINGKIEPQYGKKSAENLICITNIQNGAKKFVRDVTNSNIKENIFNKHTYFENYKNLIINPTIKNIKIFKNIEFQNLGKKKLIDNKSLLYYLFHPRKLFLDFMNSYCKVMFMKNVFKINLPYYKILKKLYIKVKKNEESNNI